MIKEKWSWSFLFHNILWHPLAGVCWFLGWNKLGDYLHSKGLGQQDEKE